LAYRASSSMTTPWLLFSTPLVRAAARPCKQHQQDSMLQLYRCIWCLSLAAHTCMCPFCW
jgi:hypothetical protein